MKATVNGKRVTRWDIAVMIENLPGNRPWSSSSLITTFYDHFSLAELVDKYNSLVKERGLDYETIKLQ